MGGRLPEHLEMTAALAVAGVVALLVFPLPTALLDVLLAGQLAASVVILLAALGARGPQELSVFPTLLLLTTLVRLALNVSTTRLVLAQADAGAVVAAFGGAVVAGDLLAGAVVFAALTVVQYLVIARGAERVAQVSARFALDALPGHQLAIDADLRGDLIDPEAARARREALKAESGLLGAMDGAMKFVRGDAIAGLVIVGVNFVGGLVAGVVQRGLPVGEALRTYTVLTIGDGLASQLPAVLTTTAAALVATRAAAPSAGAPDLRRLLSGRPLAVAAGLMALLALLPGLPEGPLAGVAVVLGAGALRARRTKGPPRAAAAVHGLGLALHPEAARALGAHPPRAVVDSAAARLRTEYGVDLPPVALELDARDLPPGTYRLEVSEAVVARDRLPVGLRFAPAAGGEARDRARGTPGTWVSGPGLTPAEYLTRHLVAVARSRGDLVLGLQAVADRLARLEARHPALVRAVVPRRVDLPRLARLLRGLLAEDVPVRDLRAVLEALAQLPADVTDEAAQLQALRQGLAALITHRAAPDGRLAALFPDAGAEAALRRAGGPGIDESEALLEAIESHLVQRPDAALVVPPDLRAAARALVAQRLPGLPVLTAEEIHPGTETEVVGLVGVT